MKITYELDLNTFEAWSGAVDTLNRVIAEGKTDELESVLNDIYPDGLSETQLNDILWFEDEWIFETLGIRSESVINEELKEAKEELTELKEAFQDELEEETERYNSNRELSGMNELSEREKSMLGAKIWADNYAQDAGEIEERIAELEEELENI